MMQQFKKKLNLLFFLIRDSVCVCLSLKRDNCELQLKVLTVGSIKKRKKLDQNQILRGKRKITRVKLAVGIFCGMTFLHTFVVDINKFTVAILQGVSNF